MPLKNELTNHHHIFTMHIYKTIRYFGTSLLKKILKQQLKYIAHTSSGNAISKKQAI